MARVKRGVMHVKNRKGILKQTKGYMWGRKNRIKLAKTAILHAGAYAYRDRRTKKRTARALWQINLSAALKPLGLSYSKFMGILTKTNVILDRKVLAELAAKEPKVFAAIVAKVQ